VFAGPLAPQRHRALQLGVLHEHTAGLVELAAGSRRDERLQITTRRRSDHYLPGGHTGEAGWMESLLGLASRHADAGEEVFLAPAIRAAARGDKHAVSETSFLWVDVDEPNGLPALWAFLAERPCHLLVESSAGHAHAYWKLDRPLPSTVLIESTGELVEPIERAHLRLIHHLGTGADGKPNVADPACAERSRVLRLAGSVNGKPGTYARILEADLALRAYPVGQLVGDLPDPASYSPPRPSTPTTNPDPYKADRPPRVLRAARRDRRPARRTRALPRPLGPGPVLLGRDGREAGVALPRRDLRRARGDLRPRLGAARRPVGPSTARRGVQARTRVCDRRVRRADRQRQRDGERPTRRKEQTMKEADGARAATDERPATAEVAPRFTRAVKAERSWLEGKRAQLLRKREAAQASSGGSIEPWRRPMSCSSCSRHCSPPTAANPTRPAKNGTPGLTARDRRPTLRTGEGARTMSTRNGRVTRPRPPTNVGEELMGAADAIADMAQRVQLNGPEPTYASEKLSYALFKAAEGLALCDVELAEVTEEARRGHEHGTWVREDAR
jgi:hypothetical protein